jgi:hypothetical protein
MLKIHTLRVPPTERSTVPFGASFDLFNRDRTPY